MIDWVHKESVTQANVCDTCGHQYSDICGTCESLDGVPVKYTEKEAEFKMHKEYVGNGSIKIPVYGWKCTGCGGIVGINPKEFNYCPVCGRKIKSV